MSNQAITKRPRRIKDLPLSQRPQEKLLNMGAENVSESELIAILLGTGTKKKNALSLANSFLHQYPFERLSTLPVRTIRPMPGIGKVKILRLVAAFELGRRLFQATDLNSTTISSVKDVLSEVKEISTKKQESLQVLYVNARQQLIQKETIAIGRLNTLYIEPKEIFAPAISTPCYGLYIVHNHPSGDPFPSNEDIQFTLKLQQAAEILGILLLDHLIISESKYFSFQENATTSIVTVEEEE